jgi:hypothetical protein
VSKFLLKLLVKILKVLPNSEIYLNLKIKTPFYSFPLSAQPIPFGLLAHPAPPTSLFLLHCAGPLHPGLSLPSSARLAHAHPWRISRNTFLLSEGAYHGTRRPSSSSTCTDLERTQPPPAAGFMPPPWPPLTTSAEEKKTSRRLLHSPIKRRPLRSSTLR